MKIRVRGLGLGGISLILLAVGAWAYLDQFANGAVTRAWLRQYNSVVSNSVDVVSAVLRDPAGNIIVAGNSDDRLPGGDMLLLKYSGQNGSLLWLRRLSGPTNSPGIISAAAVDARGNIAITGHSFNGEDRDYYTAKFSTEGTLLWSRSYDGPSDDAAMAVTFDRSGNVVVTGGSSQDEWRNDDDDLTRLDYYTAKYAAADGALLWERRYNGPGDRRDEARAVAIDANDNIVVTGYSDGETGRDSYTLKYTTDGALLWDQRYHGPSDLNDRAYALALDASGNVIVAGVSEYHAHTAKFAGTDGALVWERRYGGPADYDAAALAVAVDSSGNVAVTGRSYTAAFAAKYAGADGTVLWERLSDSTENTAHSGNAVAMDALGNVVVAGYLLTGYVFNFYTAKYGAIDGSLLWEHRQDGPRVVQDRKAGVIIDTSGNVFVAGTSGAGYGDIYTAHLAAADGAAVWQQWYNGPSHRLGQGEAAAIDAHGNLIVAGYSEGEDSDFDYLTLKYAPNGTLLWERRYNGPGNSGDYPRAMALDSQGNVFVTGQSEGGGGRTFDYYTAKYAAADGAVLWEQRYNGTGNWGDYAQALAVDRDGNVIVTGYSHRAGPSGPGDLEYYTAKYAGSNGAVQWERHFPPSTGHAAAYGIAVDASGNAVVTGSVWTGAGTGTDFYTVKYAAADGRTIWERQYNGPANGYDEPLAVAMDGEGNAFVNGRSQGNYTVKYSAASGQVLWERRDSFGSPGALAVDVHGNVIVGGTHTAKYAATNGALLWDRKIDQSSNGPVFIRAIALDPVGNVFLGGMGYRNNDPQKDFFTTKYAAADGALLWQLYDDGPGERDDRIERQGALAVGPNGMVAITGTSGGFGGEFYGHDFTTVVYRDTLGAPPQISIAAPANGSQWLAGSTITLVADVTDPDAIVDSVEFLAGDTSLGISSSSPWTVTWANVPAGTHTLTARAMDPLGPITVSATVAITVTNPPPGPTVNLLATDRLARERSPYLQPDTATFIVHRSGSLNSSLTVYYDLAGSASNGVDYLQLPGSVTIPIGQRFARIVVVPRKDAIREGQEDVRITLRPPPAGAASYTLGKYSQANVYIFD